MSKAFLKDDAPDEHVAIIARPPLPPGTPNYVTPRGLRLLRDELAHLSAERAQLQSGVSGDAPEQARRLGAVHERLSELIERLESAQLVAPGEAQRGEVGFGATVTARTLTGKFSGEENRFTVVGVDEAADDETCVAFTAPIARALMGHKVGEQAQMQTPRGKQLLEVVATDYEA